MKILLIAIVLISLIFTGCTRWISPFEAASHKQKCGRGYVG